MAAGDQIAPHLSAPFALGSLRNGGSVREVELPAPDNPADVTRQIVDHGAVIAANATQARFLTTVAATCIPLIGAPPFIIGVASGSSDPELQSSLVELAVSAARTDLDRVDGVRRSSA